jgi:hypothetical protein
MPWSFSSHGISISMRVMGSSFPAHAQELKRSLWADTVCLPPPVFTNKNCCHLPNLSVLFYCRGVTQQINNCQDDFSRQKAGENATDKSDMVA